MLTIGFIVAIAGIFGLYPAGRYWDSERRGGMPIMALAALVVVAGFAIIIGSIIAEVL